jgi:carboxylate-amine ligase
MVWSFASSEFGTLGVEFEATIIDRETLRPLALASQIAEEATPALRRGAICPDYVEQTLEFNTGICTSIDDVQSDLRATYGVVRPILERDNAVLLGMGLPAFSRPEDFEIVDGPRYRAVLHEFQWAGRRLVTNGIHMHVGMPTGDHAIRAAGALRSVLPILLALSASSPFRHGELTGLASTRLAVRAPIPQSGPMPDFADMDDYISFCEAMQRSNAITTLGDLRWDCRPNLALGTLEIRISDSVAEMDDLLALCALAWCMAVGIESLESFRLPNELSNENRWRAIRYGTQCDFIIDAAGQVQPVSVLTDRIIDALDATAESLGCSTHLYRCGELGLGRATHQRLTVQEATMSTRELATAAELTMRVDW